MECFCGYVCIYRWPLRGSKPSHHNSDVIMSTVACQITSLTVVYSTVYPGADQRKHQSSASLAFVRGIHRWPVNSSHNGPVMRKMSPFDDVIMTIGNCDHFNRWFHAPGRICYQHINVTKPSRHQSVVSEPVHATNYDACEHDPKNYAHNPHVALWAWVISYWNNGFIDESRSFTPSIRTCPNTIPLGCRFIIDADR